MTAGLEEIEAFEKSTQRIVDLLNQIEQGLNECKTFLGQLQSGAPEKTQTRVQSLSAALNSVDTVLADMNRQHNITVGELTALRQEIQEHAAAQSSDPGY